MASIDRTAYPQFKRNPVVRELVAFYTPSDTELVFVTKHARQAPSRLTLAILLKSFQRLKYFPALDEVPLAVIRHIRASLKFRMQIKPAIPSTVTLYRYHQLVRKHLQFQAFEHGGLDAAARAIQDAAAVMDNPPDLINVGIEQLVKDRFELPAFSTLDRLGRRIRTLVNGRLFAEMERRLTTEEKERLDALVQSKGSAAKSPLHEVKRLPKRSSLKHFQELLDHMARLDELVATEQPLAGIPELKRKHFAAEARVLDAAELKDFRPTKRRALLLCLIHRARVQARDDLADMFIKRIGKIHNHGKEELERLRIRYREKAETLVATMSDVIRVLSEHHSDTTAGATRSAQRLVRDVTLVIVEPVQT